MTGLIISLKRHPQLRSKCNVLEEGRQIYVGHLANFIASRNTF